MAKKRASAEEAPQGSPFNVIDKGAHVAQGREEKPGPGRRLIEEYRKNYCPRRFPDLVLPTAPNDTEKYDYVNMKHPFLVSVGLVALLSLAVGSWMFA